VAFFHVSLHAYRYQRKARSADLSRFLSDKDAD
jgi:hypothetical protein